MEGIEGDPIADPLEKTKNVGEGSVGEELEGDDDDAGDSSLDHRRI